VGSEIWRYSPFGPGPALVGIVVIAIAAMTLTTQGWTTHGYVNLVVGRGISEELHNVNREVGVANVVGNVVMFVPLGWLLRLVTGRTWRAVVVAAAFSTFIETVQFFTGRAADVDDVVLNTTGALLGAVAVSVVLATVRRPRSRGERLTAPLGRPSLRDLT
jgi:glycopeptide antibiotics resistance protein